MRKTFLHRIAEFGRYFEFISDIIRNTFRRPVRIKLIFDELEHLGVDSIPVIVLAGLAIGMIFALQMVSLLQPFQAEIGVGAAVAVALGRELAPIITTLMLIAKNGSAMAAELGTMRVTEQIDAMESMSVLPVHYLVVPRVIASVIVFPILTLLAGMVGVAGAYVIATRLYGIDAASYADYMFNVLKPKDIYSGMIKGAVMGFIVSSISCFFGLSVAPGAKGVGDGATKAVVASSVAILLADYVMATVMMAFFFP